MALLYLASIINTCQTCVMQSMYLEVGVLLLNIRDPSSWSVLANLLGTGSLFGMELVLTKTLCVSIKTKALPKSPSISGMMLES